jgi:hypothetical protein
MPWIGATRIFFFNVKIGNVVLRVVMPMSIRLWPPQPILGSNIEPWHFLPLYPSPFHSFGKKRGEGEEGKGWVLVLFLMELDWRFEYSGFMVS